MIADNSVKFSDNRQQIVKSCLECKKPIVSKVYNYHSFKGHLLHIKCADSLFSTLFLISAFADNKTFTVLKRRSKSSIVKVDKCLICGEHASGATGFKHRIIYEGHEVQLKIHKKCFFNRFNLEYDSDSNITE